MTQTSKGDLPEDPKPIAMQKRILDFILKPRFLGLIAGALGGYLYYTEIGCKQGTCPITSNPWLTVLWGAVMGYLIGDMFRPKTPKG